MPECWMDCARELDDGLKELLEDKKIYLLYGPWTKLAQRLLQSPSFKNEVEQGLVLGGSCPSTSTVANADILADPEAAEFVLRSGVPVTVLTDEVLKKYSALEAVQMVLQESKELSIVPCGLHVETRSHLCRGFLISDVHSDQKFTDRHCTLVTLA